MLEKVKGIIPEKGAAKKLKISPSKLAIPIFILVFVIIFIKANFGTDIESTEAGEAAGAGYQTIEYVDGVNFSVAQDFMSKATAISSISEGMDIQKDSYYMFKNNGTQFMLFCVDNVVIAVQKGTRFNFAQTEDKVAALGNSSVMNIWFEKSYKRANVEEINETLSTIPVNAGVVFTNEVYADYCGELAVLNDGTDEWSIFVGVPGTRFDKLDKGTQKAIKAMAESITKAEHVAQAEETYAVSLKGTSTEQEAVETTEPEIVETEPEIVEVTPTPTPTTPTPTPDLPVPETTEEEPVEDDAVIIEDDPMDFKEDLENNTIIKKSALNFDNQKTIVSKSDDKAYSSSIFSMLNLGDSGIITELDVDTGQYEQPIINIEKLYTDKNAVTIIQNYCNSGVAKYQYFAPPEASSWHVVKYKLNYSKCASMPYINIKLKGLDGENLRFRGVEYSPKTRDIAYKSQKEGDWYIDILCYYEVPNGCKEYVLECGSGTVENRETTELRSAYYYIKVPQDEHQDVYNVLDSDRALKELRQKRLDGPEQVKEQTQEEIPVDTVPVNTVVEQPPADNNTETTEKKEEKKEETKEETESKQEEPKEEQSETSSAKDTPQNNK